MTIRSAFQPDVDRFINDLTDFATGSYLQEGETEYWEAPFDAEVLPELKRILERLLDNLDALPDDPNGEQLLSVVNPLVAELKEFNASQQDAVLEPEEWQELQELLVSSAGATGADDEALAELPDLDD